MSVVETPQNGDICAIKRIMQSLLREKHRIPMSGAVFENVECKIEKMNPVELRRLKHMMEKYMSDLNEWMRRWHQLHKLNSEISQALSKSNDL